MTSYTYDKRGQQLSATMVVTTLSGNQTITTSSTYDNAGKTLATTDPLGRVTRPIYDQYSRPYKTIFADGSFTEMGYDSRGRKIWDRQQRLEGEPIIQTDYEYDDLGRLIAVVQPQAGWHCFTYSLSSAGTCETFAPPALLEVYLKLCHST